MSSTTMKSSLPTRKQTTLLKMCFLLFTMCSTQAQTSK